MCIYTYIVKLHAVEKKNELMASLQGSRNDYIMPNKSNLTNF